MEYSHKEWDSCSVCIRIWNEWTDPVVVFLQDMKLINDTLTTKVFVDILSCDDPKVSDEHGGVNLDLEVLYV